MPVSNNQYLLDQRQHAQQRAALAAGERESLEEQLEEAEAALAAYPVDYGDPRWQELDWDVFELERKLRRL